MWLSHSSVARPRLAATSSGGQGCGWSISSREAKQEAIRQHKLEMLYEAEQASWGLPTPSSAAPGVGVAASSAPRPSLGRGKHVVRPAWLVRQNQGRALGDAP